MSNQDNPTDDALADGAHVTPADGAAAAVSDALALEELNKALGKQFKDVPTALKALADTQSYVGKRKEDIEAEVRATMQPSPQSADVATRSEVLALKEQLFYTQNPQYKGLESLIKTMGSDPAEVVNSDTFKNVFEKVKVADEVDQKRSVVNSSPRLQQSRTNLEEAVKIANSRASGTDLAEHLAKSVIEAIGDA